MTDARTPFGAPRAPRQSPAWTPPRIPTAEMTPPHKAEEPAEGSIAELENSLAQVANQQTPRPNLPTTTDAAIDRSNNTLDLVTSHIIEKISKLRDELSDLERLIIDDMGRVKNELRSHVELAAAADKQCDQIKTMIGDLRAQRTELAKARTQ